MIHHHHPQCLDDGSLTVHQRNRLLMLILTLYFIFSTIPVQSMPPGATHRIRVWLKSLVPLTTDPAIAHPLPFGDSYIYQRLFKLDEFKVGGRLEFNALGNRLVMAFPHCDGPETISMARAPVKLEKEKGKETEKEKDRERERERDRERDREREKSTVAPGPQGNHIYSNQNHGMLPPGAQYPVHMLTPQGTFASSAMTQYPQQLPSLYPNGHANSQQSARVADGRERARSPPQVQKSRTRIEIV